MIKSFFDLLDKLLLLKELKKHTENLNNWKVN